MYTVRLTWPRFWLLVFVSPVIAVLVLVALPGSGAKIAGLVAAGSMAILFSGLAYAFRALELTIDDRELTVGFPVWHDRIALDQIVACKPITYRWWEFGGYGIRLGRSGKMFNIPGDGGNAVQLTRSRQGILMFSSRDPEAVCAAIRARRPEVLAG